MFLCTPFPGVIVKVFGSINPMWSWEWLKSREFDTRLNISSLTFQCWAPKRDYEEKQAPHPIQPWLWGLDLFFPASKSHNPESLGIKGQVRHQRFSYTDFAPWQPKNPLIVKEGVQTNPCFLIPPDFNPPRVICTQSTTQNHFHHLPRVVGMCKQGAEQDKYLEMLSDQTSALIKS